MSRRARMSALIFSSTFSAAIVLGLLQPSPTNWGPSVTWYPRDSSTFNCQVFVLNSMTNLGGFLLDPRRCMVEPGSWEQLQFLHPHHMDIRPRFGTLSSGHCCDDGDAACIHGEFYKCRGGRTDRRHSSSNWQFKRWTAKQKAHHRKIVFTLLEHYLVKLRGNSPQHDSSPVDQR